MIMLIDSVIFFINGLRLLPKRFTVSQKGVLFEGNIQQLSSKLKEKKYRVSGRDHVLFLRPGFMNSIGTSLYINKFILLHREGVIFIKCKWNHYIFFMGMIFVMILVNRLKELDYMNFMLKIGVGSGFYFFMIWTMAILIENKIKRDLKESILLDRGGF